MSYTSTKASPGLGTTISIGATPLIIGEVIDITESGRQAKTDNATNLQSPAEEFIGAIISPGTWDLTINRVGSDAGQIALETAFASLQPAAFIVQEPKGTYTTSGPHCAFNALVTESNFTYSVDKKITGKVKLQVTGLPVWSVGT